MALIETDEDLRSEKISNRTSDVLPSGIPLPKSPVESILIALLALFMLVVPTLSSLHRIASKLAEPEHSAWMVKIGNALLFLLPKDLTWASVYTQHATLWIGFLGAVLATVLGKHLGLATMHFMKPGRLRKFAETYSHLIFISVSMFLCYASLRFVMADRFGDGSDIGQEAIIDLLPGGIPKWWSELVIPIAFALMAIRTTFIMTAPASLSSIAKKSLLKTSMRWAIRVVFFLLVLCFFYVGVVSVEKMPKLLKFMTAIEPFRNTLKLTGLSLVGIGFLLGTPIFVSIAGITMLFFFGDGITIAALPVETFRLVMQSTLPAIPLLTIAGYILASGKAAQRLVRAYKSIFGWMPGGVAIMAVFVCAAFTTFTGASGVTILALGGLIFPALVKEKYPQGFSLGLVTAAGSLGMLFPPSLPVLLYALTASAPGSEAPVGMDQLYIGGLIPGILMILLVALYAVFRGIRSNAPRQVFNIREMLSAFWAAKWDLLLPFIVLVPYVTGLATIIESSALGATYALLVSLLIQRDVRPLQDLPFVMVQASTLIGAVLALLGVCLGLTAYLIDIQLPTKLVAWVQAHIQSQWVFLLVLNGILLVLGSVLEIYSAILILVPLVAPLAIVYHIDPVHLGVIFLSNLELGFLLPPVGLNLLLAANRFKRPLPQLYKHALPFLLIMTVGVLIITYFEGATTWLLHLLKK